MHRKLKILMKRKIIKTIFLLLVVNLSYSQSWMTSLDIAQKLATVQNKMVLMVWEETTKYPYHVLVNDDKGRTLVIENLFEDENISPLIWKNFVPVIVSEDQYADLYMEIKNKRKQNYIDKFNDDSIKIMDINGNILNVSNSSQGFQNITNLIETYALNTQFLALELTGYKKEKNFYSAYYLASKYIDFTLYADEKLRPELINLADIYLGEAVASLEEDIEEDKLTLKQRVELLKIQEYLVLKRPKKVLRQLNRIDAINIDNTNKTFVAFLYYTAYSILKNESKTKIWKAKVSLVNLKKAQMIINLNS